MARYSKLSLEVSTDNEKAISFYARNGLVLTEKYVSNTVEFAKFETPSPSEGSEDVKESVETTPDKKTSTTDVFSDKASTSADSDYTDLQIRASVLEENSATPLTAATTD